MYLMMASKSIGFFVFVQIINLNLHLMSAFPTPESADDKAVYSRRLSEERPLEEQIAEADGVTKIDSRDDKHDSDRTAMRTVSDNDNFMLLKSLAAGSNDPSNATVDEVKPNTKRAPDDSDSTKTRRLAEDYDSTKTGSDYKYPDDPESFRQVDGTPLTAEDIVQKIANKIYEEDDRGVFDRIVSKLLKLGLITDSQAETLEYEVAEALQELITKNAKNEVDDLGVYYPPSPGGDEGAEPDPDASMKIAEKQVVDQTASRKYKEEQAGMGSDDTVDRSWAANSEDGLQDLQYFPNFYSLLKSLNTEKDAEERETLITIMKTLIDFVKMMVKYGTITPEEGVAYLENLDTMIAVQTKSKLGKSLDVPDVKLAAGKIGDEVDNTKEAVAKMQKEYESVKDSTKSAQVATETGQPGKSNTYLEAIRKNIEWIKNQSKDGKQEEYDLSKLRDFMTQQVDSYIDRGILPKEEGEVIKKIYGSL